MSYIFIDVDAARRCAGLMNAKSGQLLALLGGEAGAMSARLEAFCRELDVLSADLSEVTESYAAADEKLKTMHLMDNEGGRLNNG